MAGSRKVSPCGAVDHRPRRPDNPPGQAEIAYRLATQPASLARMTWQLPRQAVTDPDSGARLRPLARLRQRDPADPTISLIDAFACAVDVLSFYSERVANEGYIGTATQRRSVLELARMIGYELAPGVAASTYLAFTVEDADDPYRRVEVPADVQAMSIPAAKDELPQTFATVEPVTARAEWNDIHARIVRPQNLALYRNPGNPADPDNGSLFLFDLDNSFDADVLADPDLTTIAAEGELDSYHPLAVGLDLPAALARRIEDQEFNSEIEPVLRALPVNQVTLAGVGLDLRPGARILAVGRAGPGGAVQTVPLRVVSARELPDFGVTEVVLTENGEVPDKVRRAPRFRIALLKIGRIPNRRLVLDRTALDTHVRGNSWTGDGLTALVRRQAWPRAKMMTLLRRIIAPEPEPPEATEIQLGFHLMRDDAGFFGATAPRHDTLNYGDDASGNPDKGPYPTNWDSPPATIWTDSQGDVPEGPAQVFLDREIKEMQPGGWVVLETGSGGAMGLRVTHAAIEARADYALTGKATGLGLATPDGAPVDPGEAGSVNEYNAFLFRKAHLYGVSVHLPSSGIPLPREMAAEAASVELDALYLDLERGRPVSLSGARTDAEGITGRETHLIAEVQHIDGITRLLLSGATAYPYDRTTVRINANVAPATHGERVEETLGSGDARLAHQVFRLSRTPLTYVSAANETGRASTLQVRVDGVLWHEVPALGRAGPGDGVYEVRHDDDGTVRIRFGDGRTGRRLPTGELNVAARYRAGLGRSGEVAEQAITLLKTRPLGIRAVANPSPATGASEPESLDGARLNAPNTVRTLGRIVSLTDYQDFAAAFAGVGKARARQLWSGQQKVVHLTVAPEFEAELVESDDLMVNLAAAVEAVRDPARPVVLQPYARRFFQLKARLGIHPDHLPEDVVLAARTGLQQRFGYHLRDLSQPVSAAELIAALHDLAGVVAVDLDALAVIEDGAVIDTSGAPLEAILPAASARGPGRRGGGGFEPAELLIVLPSAITLEIMETIDA